jgi:hypothetical protein
MSMDGHRHAMQLVEDAERLARDGLIEAARERYQQAAKLEERCADGAPEARPRTRGVLRVSAVSAWKLARVPEHAEALARRYLAEPIAPGFARALHQLLHELQREGHALVPREPEERSGTLLEDGPGRPGGDGAGTSSRTCGSGGEPR